MRPISAFSIILTIVFILSSVLTFETIYKNQTEFTTIIIIKDKFIIQPDIYESAHTIYYIVTNTNETYQVRDSILFTTSSLWDSFEIGKKYNITEFGCRHGHVTLYPIITGKNEK